MFFLKAENSCHQHVRKRLDVGVEVADSAAVVAPRHLQLILKFGELVLLGEEILVGLELRIGLGHREQAVQRALEFMLGGGLAGNIGGDHGG